MATAGQKAASLIPGNTSQLVVETDYSKYLEDEPIIQKPKKKTRAEKKVEKLERKAKKLIEDKKIVIADHFRRELELSRKSAQRGREAWVDMCKEIKIKELREELQAWKVKTDRVMQAKDEKIVALIADMEDTEEMHRRQYAKQVQLLDYLIVTYKGLLQSAKDVYESQVGQALEDFHAELVARSDQAELIQEHCENIMHSTNLAAKQELFSDFNIFQLKLRNKVNSEIEKRYAIRDRVVLKMTNLRQQLLSFMQTITDTSLDAGKFQRMHSLMDRQRAFSAETTKLHHAEMNIHRTTHELQRQLLHNEAEAARKLEDLNMEHAFFLRVRHRIERDIRTDRETTFDKLKVLSCESLKALKYLQQFESKGELLLSLAANCRKLQTEAEKILPYGDFKEPDETQIDEEEIIRINTLKLSEHVDMSDEDLSKYMKLMSNFWRRHAIVEGQNLMLKEQIRRLREENNKYIETIKSMGRNDNLSDLHKALTIREVSPNLSQKPKPPSKAQTSLKNPHPPKKVGFKGSSRFDH